MLEVITFYNSLVICDSVKSGWAWGQGSQPCGLCLPVLKKLRMKLEYLGVAPSHPCGCVSLSLSLHVCVFRLYSTVQ